MKLIASGFEHHVDDRAASPNVSTEIVGLDFELLNRIDGGLNDFEADLLFVVVESIEQEVIVRGRQPIHLDGPIASLVLGNAALLDDPLRPGGHPRCEVGELEEITAVQGEIIHSSLFDNLSQ